MKTEDFKLLRYFTVSEVRSTGANIDKVKLKTMIAIDNVRHMVGQPIHLLRNGMTSGNHSAKEHPNGEAVDFYLSTSDDSVAVQVAFSMVASGFRGIGVYKNEAGVYSFHGDTRELLTTWRGMKVQDKKGWEYTALTFNTEGYHV